MTTAAMSTPCREARHMMVLLKEKFAGMDAGFGIDLLRLDAVRVGRRTATQNGFAEPASAPFGDPAALVDRLANRLGSGAITVLRPRASHIPERSQAHLPALEAMAETSSSRPAYTPPWPYSKGPLRPAFVLARPEPIEVMAEVPDGPPARFIWRRVERRVARAEGPERIAPEWWRTLHLGEEQKRPRPRDYYKVEDHEGGSYWVFRHGLYGGEEESAPPSWFLHGLFA
jgi:protein ImuB